MREAWKLVADYYVALKGTISVRVRRADPSTRIAGATAVAALLFMGLHWFNSSGGADDRAGESASPDGWSLESPGIDDERTAEAAGGSEPPASDADAARSPESRALSGATEGDGAIQLGVDDSGNGAERDDALANTSAAGTSSGAVSGDSAQADGSPAPSPGGDPPASRPSADSGSEPDDECTPDSGLVTGLVGGLVCLVDDLL